MDIGSIIAIVIVVGVVAAAGGGVAAYQISRRQRRLTLKQGEEYQGPQSLPPPPVSPPLPPPPPAPQAKIRWGDMTNYEGVSPRPPEQNRIRWGQSPENPAPPPDIDLSGTDSWVKCPICQELLNINQNDAHTCPNCQTPFHQYCWDEYNQTCPICER